MTLEPMPGSFITWRDRRFECVADEVGSEGCPECAFAKGGLCSMLNCDSTKREDGKDVHFVELAPKAKKGGNK